MPIEHTFQIQPVSDDEFHALDYNVMSLVFAMHNAMGRLWSEPVYQHELAYRCREAGFEKVDIEAPIRVSYRDFHKTLYADLLLNDAVLYELKAVQTLLGEHQQQTLTYLLLLGMPHGKLVNLRPPSVESRFVSTRLRPAKRYDFAVDDREWRSLDEESLELKQLVENLLNDWGAFLDTALFYDAVIHFRGGKENVIKPVKVMNGSRFLCMQKTHLLNPETAFKFSSLTQDRKSYEQQLRRFLHFTSLKTIQWINFNHHHIEFKTLLRE